MQLAQLEDILRLHTGFLPHISISYRYAYMYTSCLSWMERIPREFF